MNPVTEAELARVAELDAKATEGPWELSYYDFETIALWGPQTKRIGFLVAELPAEYTEDSRLIAEYRTLCPRLAADLLATREALRVAREALLYVKAKAVFPLGVIPEKPWSRIDAALAQLPPANSETKV